MRAGGLVGLAGGVALLVTLGCAPDNVAVIQAPPETPATAAAPAPPETPGTAAAPAPAVAAPVAPAVAVASPQPRASVTPAPLPRAVTPPIPAGRRFVALVGERLQHDPPFLGVPNTNYFCLRSLLDRQTGQAVHQLYVSDSYQGTEKFWDAARDGDGNALRFLPIGRREITCEHGCSYIEDFAAAIPENELRAHSAGLSVTFTSRTGASKRIDVPPAMIATQLADFDAARRRLVPVVQSAR